MNGLPQKTGGEAVEPTSPDRARRAVSLLFLLNGALFATWVSRLPSVQAARGLSHGDLGLGLLGMALGALLAMPLTGQLSSRFGSRRAACTSAVIYTLTLPLLAIVPGGPAFYLLLFGFGAAHGALDVAMNAQAVMVENRGRRPVMSSLHALFSAGGLAGAAMGAGFAAMGAAPSLHFSIMAAGLLSMAAAGVFPYLIIDRQQPRRLKISAHIQKKSGWRMPSGRLFLLGLIAFCSMLGEGAMADWGAIYLREVTGAPESLAAAGFAAFSVAMLTGRLLGDGLAARFGPVKLVRGGGGLALAGIILAILSNHAVGGILGFTAVGAGLATIVPQVFSTAGRLPGTEPGPALASAATIGYFGFLLGPPLIGFAAEAAGLRLGLGLLVITNFTLVLLAPRLRPAGRKSVQASPFANPVGSPAGIL